ncbi:MAG: insulinase family protein, partial [Muribaculaceae bacterium]|nr:insulinase family protein [Muribaculaceae bacterium]
SGKKISLTPQISAYERRLNGSTTPKALQPLMELTYNLFTCPSLDAEEYESQISALKAMLANQEATPNYKFSDLLNKSLYNDARRGIINNEIADKASRESILDILHSMTDNAADYMFVFVGNVTAEQLKPLCEQYLATLPADKNKKSAYKSVPSLDIAKGSETIIDKMEMQTPQTFVAIIASADMPYTVRDRALASIAGQILSKRLIGTVREEMGAVYSISASGSLIPYGSGNAVIQSVFPMKPEMKDEVLAYIAGQFDDMKENVSQEELANVIEYMVKSAKESMEKNEAWKSAIIIGESLPGIDTMNGIIELYQSIKPSDVTGFMTRLMDQNNYRIVVLD